MKKKQGVLVLHEIYGVNEFIQSVCRKIGDTDFDIICPDLMGTLFPYEESQKAYDYFMKHVGFDVYENISRSVTELKETYDKVFIVGFSAGATVAWRCCENLSCDGIAACYGSRIRDYTELNPVCPVLLLFAENDSFDVEHIALQLQQKPQTEVMTFAAGHGFMDCFSEDFDPQAAELAWDSIFRFLWGEKADTAGAEAMSIK